MRRSESIGAPQRARRPPQRWRSGGPARGPRAGAALLVALLSAPVGCELGDEPPAPMRPDAIAPAAAPDARGVEAMAAAAAEPVGHANEPDAAGGVPPERADSAPERDAADAAPDRLDAILDAEPEGEGLDLLARAAIEDASPIHRATAIAALGDSADPRALDVLIAATEDADPSVVIAAVEELRWSDDRLARDAILRLVDSPDAAVAAAARAASEDFESPRSPAR